MTITYEQFDTCIDDPHGSEDLYFDFTPEREIKPDKETAAFTTDGYTDKYAIEKYYYGRIHIGELSYFAEVLGYYHPDAPKVVTYHIVKIDPKFYKIFTLNYSASDLSETSKMVFL